MPQYDFTAPKRSQVGIATKTGGMINKNTGITHNLKTKHEYFGSNVDRIDNGIKTNLQSF